MLLALPFAPQAPGALRPVASASMTSSRPGPAASSNASWGYRPRGSRSSIAATRRCRPAGMDGRRGRGPRRARRRAPRRARHSPRSRCRTRYRPMATPPTTSCCSTCPPTIAAGAPDPRPLWRRPHQRARDRCRARRRARRSTATSRSVSEQDLRRSELISLPLAALALLLVFGSVVAAGVPLVVGGTAVVVALAAIFFVAGVTPMSIFVLNLATLLGFGLGVDYALLLTSRFREELAPRRRWPPDRRRHEAVAATVATAGRAVFFSGLTVLLGLMGLILFEFMVLRSVGHRRRGRGRCSRCSRRDAAAGGLAIARTALDRAARSAAVAAATRRQTAAGAWARLARRVMDRPLPFSCPTLRSCCSSVPFLHVRFNAPDASILPPSRAVASRLRPARERVRRGRRSRRSSLAVRTTGAGDRPGQRRARCTTTRAGSRPTRGSPASRASSTSTRA